MILLYNIASEPNYKLEKVLFIYNPFSGNLINLFLYILLKF